ncbi:Ig-like domain-containing protein [Octadecabacter sp. CECT 8868]|nr:Ig-like domain-containing protein [Octadecabacter algicola]
MTDEFSLSIGEAERDIDAGLVDPKTGRLGDKVFIDANGNGQQDIGEAGLDGVDVTLFDADGVAIGNTVTTGGGMYIFEGLGAGDYSVGFEIEDTFVFTTADQGDDAFDSDANVLTGVTGSYTLGIGEENLTVDAGVVAANDNPEPMDDAGMICADEELTLDVLANDSDPDGDALTITAVDGQAIAEGESITTGEGTIVTLSGGQLVFDGEAAYAALDIGHSALENISYTVDDGNGGTGDANVAVTFCGDANSVDSLIASIPDGDITYQVQSSNIVLPVEEYAFNVVISGTGDGRFDDVVIFEAYCLDRGDPVGRAEDFADAPFNTGTLTGANEATATDAFDASQVSAFNGLSAADNLDLISYILNEDLENNGFTGWEVQRAVWELTNDDDLAYLDGIDAGFGLNANVDLILADAAANGEGFVAGVGDKIGVIIDPGDSDPTNTQPFIIAINFEDYDCIC